MRAASCGIGNDEKSNSEIGYNEKDATSTSVADTSTVDYPLELQSSVIHDESEYVSSDNRWTHHFYDGAHLVANEKESWESSWSTPSNIYHHKLIIENRSTWTSFVDPYGNRDISKVTSSSISSLSTSSTGQDTTDIEQERQIALSESMQSLTISHTTKLKTPPGKKGRTENPST